MIWMGKVKPRGLRRPRVERDWSTHFQLLVAMELGGANMSARVRSALLALFERWPDARALAVANPAAVQRVLQPLGLAKQRASTAIAIASAAQTRFGGDVRASIDEMVSLGVGKTVANVVLRRAFGVVAGAPPSTIEEDVPASTVDASRLPADWEDALGPALAELDVPGVIARVAKGVPRKPALLRDQQGPSRPWAAGDRLGARVAFSSELH